MRGNSSSFAHVFMSDFAMWKPTLFETNHFETNKFERIRFGKNRNKRSFVISFLKEAAMSIGRAKKDKQLMCRCVLRGKGKLGSVISVFAELFSRRFDGVCGRFF